VSGTDLALLGSPDTFTPSVPDEKPEVTMTRIGRPGRGQSHVFGHQADVLNQDREDEMATVTVEVPDDAFSALRRSPKEFARDMRVAAAIQWYHQRLISQGKAAAIAGEPQRLPDGAVPCPG
jgi:hypothetical protein